MASSQMSTPATGAPSQIFSPVQLAVGSSTHSHSSHTSSPLVTGQAGPSSSGTGPHRQSLPPKSRPSPLIKPTHHRHRHAGNGSIPSSPLIPTHRNGTSAMSAPGSGAGIVPGTYLPSSALEQVVQTASNSSTPSPVDLREIMPPPPVPSRRMSGAGDAVNGGSGRNGSAGHAHVQPMTPAALMNMGSNPTGLGASMSRGLGSGMGSVTVPAATEGQPLRGRQGGVNANGQAMRNGNTVNAPGSAKVAIAPLPGKGRKAALAPAAPSMQDGSSPGAAGSALRKGKGVKKGGRGGGAVGVRAGKSTLCYVAYCLVDITK